MGEQWLPLTIGDLRSDLNSSNSPEHLWERVLAWLPWENVFRSRLVCKEWNTLLSSAKFLSFWINSRSWLLFLAANKSKSGLYYCFYTRRWNSLSLCFLPRVRHLNYCHRCKGSSPGVVLAEIPILSNTFYVCNPLTRQSLRLPRMLSKGRPQLKGIARGADSESYIVVVVERYRNGIEIYNSKEKAWFLAVPAPISCYDVAYCNGLLFCLSFKRPSRILGVTVYSLQNARSSDFVELPLAASRCRPPYARLVVCDSSVLVATLVLGDMIVWEFGKDFSWKEIARMPPSLVKCFIKTESRSYTFPSTFFCVVAGDYMCFGGPGNSTVVTFNLKQQIWDWLPGCPLGCKMAAFNPRLDMLL